MSFSTSLPSVLKPSRVAFFPDYHRTQSGSNGSDKLIVSFNKLVDVMDLIGLREKDDYERVLVKERKLKDISLLQILGAMQVIEPVKS